MKLPFSVSRVFLALAAFCSPGFTCTEQQPLAVKYGAQQTLDLSQGLEVLLFAIN